MMNTYLNILTTENSAYYYAQLTFEDHFLVLTIDQGLKRSLKKRIPLEFIENLQSSNYLGGQTIRFTVNETQFTFFEFGNSVIDYLKENLLLV